MHIHRYTGEYISIQWGVKVPKNTDYLPENKTTLEFVKSIREIIIEPLSKSVPDKYKKEDILIMEPDNKDDSDYVSIHTATVPVEPSNLGETLDSLDKIEISSTFGSTEIYLASENPEESLNELLRYQNISEVYDIIFDKNLGEELNLQLNV